MKKLFISILAVSALAGLASCSNSEKTIKVCASELPHAKILNECVKPILEKQGYTLKVSSIAGWTMQNPGTSDGDYDANYFQHLPYLNEYNSSASEANQLIFTCKVHYEPLSVYRGSNETASITDANVKFAICNDVSNAIRALQLLQSLNVFETIPVSEDGTKLTFSDTTWTDSSTGRGVTLIKEDLLPAAMSDKAVDFCVLPANTVLTGNVDKAKFIAAESDSELISSKANGLAVRKNDYLNNVAYKEKIDALTDALLSTEVRAYVQSTWGGGITCDDHSQIDMRSLIK